MPSGTQYRRENHLRPNTFRTKKKIDLSLHSLVEIANKNSKLSNLIGESHLSLAYIIISQSPSGGK